jgi:TRAP-type C4-dicarboxylate transport system permease small subunit
VSKLVDAYYRLLNVLIVATVVILIIPVMMQILSRFTTLIPRYIWTEEMARFFFIWMVMLGAMVAVREGTHFDVDVWPELRPRADAILRMVSSVFMLMLAGVFVWWGVQFTAFGWDQTSEIADLPMWLIFIVWPLLGVTWVLFIWQGWVRDLRLLSREEST